MCDSATWTCSGGEPAAPATASRMRSNLGPVEDAVVEAEDE